jgi:hypothetical protein
MERYSQQDRDFYRLLSNLLQIQQELESDMELAENQLMDLRKVANEITWLLGKRNLSAHRRTKSGETDNRIPRAVRQHTKSGTPDSSD